MEEVIKKIPYLSPSQLKVLYLLAKSEKGIISSSSSSSQINKKGKSLGAIFSSLIRRKFVGQSLILPWGRNSTGNGLRFKLNEKLISKERLLKIVLPIIKS